MTRHGRVQHAPCPCVAQMVRARAGDLEETMEDHHEDVRKKLDEMSSNVRARSIATC